MNMLLSKVKEIYWKEVYWTYYMRELSKHNLKPTIEMELVCEYLETIWQKK
ncbi:hypothetical protein J2X77_000474 [Sphingobacterium sp. 2149]|nr:hypothetical protein [Sphingobacterium sp. 2149]